MKTPRLVLIAIPAVVLAFAGCGDDDGGGSGGGELVKLSETDFKITPATPKVAQPGEVTFQVSNDGDTDHALELEGPGGEQETDTIAPGESAELTVDVSEEGTFEMYCPVGNHKEMGMVGEIVVGSGGSGSAEDSGGEPEDDSGGGAYGY